MSTTFEKEFVPLQQKLFGYCMKRTRNYEDAQDLCQATMMTAWRKVEKYTPGTDAKSWLFIIARRTWINKSKARGRVDDKHNLFGEYVLHTGRHTAPPEERTAPFSDEVVKALGSLAPERAEALVYCEVLGYEKCEYSAQRGVPAGTTMSRVFRARHQLQPKLREYAQQQYGIGL